jgi:hypothetical protein
VRRTTSIDVTWRDGRHGARTVVGVGRDIHTPGAGGKPEVLAFDAMTAEVASDGSLVSIASDPACECLMRLEGERRVRRALDALTREGLVRPSPLHQLVDDIPWVAVVADWAWSRWPDLLHRDEALRREARLRTMAGICIGFRPRSSAFATGGRYQEERAAAVLPLVHPDDAEGWHPIVEPRGVSMRRARCMDLWRDGALHLEASFQDSATTPDERRIAVHEYGIRVVADSRDQVIRQISATPHVLPFGECPAAVENIHLLIGTPLAQLRWSVPQTLRRTLGCTHLNDALRALAGMASLAAFL